MRGDDKEDNTTKTFSNRFDRDYKNTFNEIIDWAEVFNTSYHYVEINYIEVRITKENDGGCRTGYDKVEKINGLKISIARVIIIVCLDELKMN
jgi:hypothetical protein